jgi:hypothetical protein
VIRGRVASLARFAAGVVVAGAALTAACGSHAIKTTCVPVVVSEVDVTARCFHPPVTSSVLSACSDPTDAEAGDGDLLVCLVDGAGRVYLASVASTAKLVGAGWTYEAYGPFASTLTPADEVRCASAATVNAAVGCS